MMEIFTRYYFGKPHNYDGFLHFHIYYPLNVLKRLNGFKILKTPEKDT